MFPEAKPRETSRVHKTYQFPGPSLISSLSRDMLSTNKTLEKGDFDYWYTHYA
jgi:hypothetical protein